LESAIAKGTLHAPPPTIPAKQNCNNGSDPLAPIVMPKTGINMVNAPTRSTDLNRNMNLNLLNFRAEKFKNPNSDTISRIITIVASNS